MEIAGLEQPPFNTTLLGCIKGASSHFEIDLSPPMLFGLTGHAFLINIHDELCPSGPYCWNTDGFQSLLGNIGIKWGEAWHFGKNSSIEDRQSAEDEIKQTLENGNLCILTFLENQLISGYDEDGFNLLMPWQGKADSERERVTFGTWEECLDTAGFAGFRIVSKSAAEVGSIRELVKPALNYALELFRDPEKYQCESGHYRIGYGAYQAWIDSVAAGKGDTHGNWWNGMVWAECRQMGARFFSELKEHPGTDEASKLSEDLANLYEQIGGNLYQIADKEMESNKKIQLLESTLELEHQAEKMIDSLVGTF